MPQREWKTEEKLAVVLDGLRGVRTIGELCEAHQITTDQYYAWHDRFLEGGKCALAEPSGTDAPEACHPAASAAEPPDAAASMEGLCHQIQRLEAAVREQAATLDHLTASLRTQALSNSVTS